MQTENASENPVLLQVDFEGEHFCGSNQDVVYTQIARNWAFLLWQTGHPDFQLENYPEVVHTVKFRY